LKTPQNGKNFEVCFACAWGEAVAQLFDALRRKRIRFPMGH